MCETGKRETKMDEINKKLRKKERKEKDETRKKER